MSHDESHGRDPSHAILIARLDLLRAAILAAPANLRISDVHASSRDQPAELAVSVRPSEDGRAILSGSQWRLRAASFYSTPAGVEGAAYVAYKSDLADLVLPPPTMPTTTTIPARSPEVAIA